ncbi:MAG: glycosyltransferase family 4 protein, partial [Chloroflexota bacterium]
VGTLEPRKNIPILIEAFRRARDIDHIPHALVLVGGAGWQHEAVRRTVVDQRLEDDVIFTGYVPPGQLPLWYNGADLFAYPSLYEGFGLPVLEAMACGVPTITTATTPAVELGAGACLTIEPEPEALHMALIRALSDTDLRSKLRQAGPLRARGFTWLETARRTAAIYGSLNGYR